MMKRDAIIGGSIGAVVGLLIFMIVPAALASNETIPIIPPDCDDEECINDAMKEMCESPSLVAYSWCDYQKRTVSSNCWSIDCVKQQLIQSCEALEEPEYIDCNTILACINITELQSDYCAGDGYPTLVLRKT